MKEFERQETVIYGGAFNPPTLAHEAILQACVEYAEPRGADVWLLPSASRVDKAIETNRDRRLLYCEALTQDVLRRTVQIATETSELDRGFQTETFDTVRELEERYQDRRFTWVFGADSVHTMEEWGHGEWLKKHLSMLVINRAGVLPVVTAENMTALPVDPGNYSSTELRRRMAEGIAFDDMVGPQVRALLEAQE